MATKRRPEEMHSCAAAACPRRCQLKHLMCWIHWCQVPRELQRRIYDTCGAGKGAAYEAAVREAVEIIARKDAAKAGLTGE